MTILGRIVGLSIAVLLATSCKKPSPFVGWKIYRNYQRIGASSPQDGTPWRILFGGKPSEYDLRWNICLDRGIDKFKIKFTPLKSLSPSLRLSWIGESGVAYPDLSSAQAQGSTESYEIIGNQATFRAESGPRPLGNPFEPTTEPPVTGSVEAIYISEIYAHYDGQSPDLDDPLKNRFSSCVVHQNESLHAVSGEYPIRLSRMDVNMLDKAIDYYIRPDNIGINQTYIRLTNNLAETKPTADEILGGVQAAEPEIGDSAFYKTFAPWQAPKYFLVARNTIRLAKSGETLEPLYLTTSVSRVNGLLDYTVELSPSIWQNNAEVESVKKYLSAASAAVMSATDGNYRLRKLTVKEESLPVDGDIYVLGRDLNYKGECSVDIAMDGTSMDLIGCLWRFPDYRARALVHQIGHFEFHLEDEIMGKDQNSSSTCHNTIMANDPRIDFCWAGNHNGWSYVKQDGWSTIKADSRTVAPPRGTPDSEEFLGVENAMRNSVLEFR